MKILLQTLAGVLIAGPVAATTTSTVQPNAAYDSSGVYNNSALVRSSVAATRPQPGILSSYYVMDTKKPNVMERDNTYNRNYPSVPINRDWRKIGSTDKLCAPPLVPALLTSFVNTGEIGKNTACYIKDIKLRSNLKKSPDKNPDHYDIVAMGYTHTSACDDRELKLDFVVWCQNPR